MSVDIESYKKKLVNEANREFSKLAKADQEVIRLLLEHGDEWFPGREAALERMWQLGGFK